MSYLPYQNVGEPVYELVRDRQIFSDAVFGDLLLGLKNGSFRLAAGSQFQHLFCELWDQVMDFEVEE